MKKKIEDLKKSLWSRMRNYTDDKRLLKRYMNDLNIIQRAGEELANHSPQVSRLIHVKKVPSQDKISEDTQKGCEHKLVGSNVAGIVRCIYCDYTEDLRGIAIEDKKEGCGKCGKTEEEHPYGYTTPINSRMQFIWKCRKFKPQKGCGKATAKRCINFQGFYCDNKDCLNEDCPLCPVCSGDEE